MKKKNKRLEQQKANLKSHNSANSSVLQTISKQVGKLLSRFRHWVSLAAITVIISCIQLCHDLNQPDVVEEMQKTADKYEKIEFVKLADSCYNHYEVRNIYSLINEIEVCQELVNLYPKELSSFLSSKVSKDSPKAYLEDMQTFFRYKSRLDHSITKSVSLFKAFTKVVSACPNTNCLTVVSESVLEEVSIARTYYNELDTIIAKDLSLVKQAHDRDSLSIYKPVVKLSKTVNKVLNEKEYSDHYRLYFEMNKMFCRCLNIRLNEIQRDMREGNYNDPMSIEQLLELFDQ